MPERGDPNIGVIAALGRLVMGCLDVLLLASSCLCLAGSLICLYTIFSGGDVSPIDEAFVVVSFSGMAFSLCLILAWGFSRRLATINRHLEQMRKDLTQLIQQTKH